MLKNKKIVLALLLLSTMLISLLSLTSGSNLTWNGIEYTNIQPSGSLRLPQGVTPDKSYDVVVRLNVAPNPSMIGETVVINGWLSPPLSPSRYHTDYEFKLTKPDGTIETHLRDSFRADGTAWLTIVPDQVGNWTVDFNFNGSYWPAGNYTYPVAQGGHPVSFPNSVYFKPNSKSMTLTVVDTAVPGWPYTPLPTDYWTRPVGPDHRDWWPILGWYPADGISVKEETEYYWPENTNRYAQSKYGFVPFTQAPLSAHVVHIRDNMIGGLMGADIPGVSHPYIDRQFSQHVRPKGPNIIYSGIAYEMVPTELRSPPRDSQTASQFPNSPHGTPNYVLEAYDIRTGEILFQRYDIPYNQQPTVVTYWEGYPEIEGSSPLFSRYVWLTCVNGGRLINYHPFTGTPVHNISIAPLSTGILYTHKEDPHFEGAGRVPFFLTVQNLGSSVPASQRYRLIEWTATGTAFRRSALHDFQMRVTSNITWPWANLGTIQDFETMTAFRNVAVNSIYTTGTAPPGREAVGSPDNNIVEAASMTTGQVLWSKETGIHHSLYSGSTCIADHGKVAFRYTDGFFHVFDQRTGEKVWVSKVSSEPWGYFPDYGVGSYGGKIIVGQADGVVSYDWKTGEISWFFQAKHPYPAETGYGDATPFFGGSPLIADGVVYYANGMHTIMQPLPRGWKLYAINATTGEYIWSLAGTRTHQQGSTFIDPLAIGDGYLAFPNGHDGRTYIIGKGPSKTTVSAPQSNVRVDEVITITGTVTDQSPAQLNTPAIADQYQGEWMEHLHMNYPKPSHATGVPVTIEVIDANNNRYPIGTVTSDLSGNFGLSWQPIISGQYQVIATFGGSNSYGSSQATTYFTASDSEPTPTVPQQELLLPPLETYIIAATIAIIASIAIATLIIKKRP